MDTPPEPLVIWPAPGLPAFLGPDEKHVEMIVAHRTERIDDLKAWARSLALRRVADTERVPLRIVDAVPAAIGELDRRVSGFAALPQARSLSFARLRLHFLNALAPLPPASVALYDLVHPAGVARSRAVAVWRERSDRLRLAFVSDLHMAAFWQVMAEAVDRHAPDLAPRFLNSRRLLERFVSEANRLWARGELDVIVLGGDLVESVYAQPRTKTSAGGGETNVRLVVEALAGLRVPTVALAGNHDYRAYPWRPRSYGLQAVGIPRSRGRALLKAADLWDPWPLHPADGQALRTHDDAGLPTLSHHLARLAPATDFALALRGLRLVFASTGCDLVAGWRRIERARRGLFLRALRTTWANPDSEGLYDDQVRRLASALPDPNGTAVFFHAPLLHVVDGADLGAVAGGLDEHGEDDLAARVAFERRLWRAGLRSGVLFRNPGPVLRNLVSSQSPTVVFSGHAHHATAIELDRRTGAARSMAVTAPSRPRETVALFTAPGLGQTWSAGPSPSGYLLARFEGGVLSALEQRDLVRDMSIPTA